MPMPTLLALVASIAAADVVEIEFAGTVSLSTDADIPVGTTFTGTFAYDTATAVSSADVNVTRYAGGATELTLTLSDGTFSGADGQVNLTDSAWVSACGVSGTGFDAVINPDFGAGTVSNTGSLTDYTRMFLILSGASPGAYAPDFDLPTTLDASGFCAMQVYLFDSVGGTQIRGVLDALAPAGGATDVDGDGFTSDVDCDDDDATVYPGAPELCDGLDNDCSGTLGALERDPDGDGILTCGPDNCPDDANADQDDGDGDGQGDSCDACPLDDANDADGDGICGDADACPTDTAADEPTTELLPNHWAFDGVSSFETATRGQGRGKSSAFTLADTHGCSCAQIVDACGYGGGHLEHGCSNGVMAAWAEGVCESTP